MSEYTLNKILPAVTEVTTLEAIAIGETYAILSTPENKEIHINIIPGTIHDYVVKGDLIYLTSCSDALVDTLKMIYAKPILFDPTVEDKLTKDIDKYCRGCGLTTTECNKGTYAIVKLTKASTGEVTREYVEYFRGCEGAFRWIIAYMLNNPTKGFKYETRTFKDYIYKDFEDGSRIAYAPYHLSNQEPTSEFVKSFK